MGLKPVTICAITLFASLFFAESTFAQSDFAPWGNILGIRKQGQLFDFETSLEVFGLNDSHGHSTYKEAQRPHYERNSINLQTVKTNIDNIYINEMVRDVSGGKIAVNLSITAKQDTFLRGAFFCIRIPLNEFVNSKVKLNDPDISDFISPAPFLNTATGLKVSSKKRNFKISFGGAIPVTLKKDTSNGKNNLFIYLQLTAGQLRRGDTINSKFTIEVSGEVDKHPVKINVDTTKVGRPFEGLGGNFRLQFPKTDEEVIDYSLTNLRVAWGRVEMPWRFWQPKQNMSPGDSSSLSGPVQKAMEMAQRLSKKNIPIILTAWSAPDWAIVGKPHFRPVNGVWGNKLNPDSISAIYKSITDYIIYLKVHYGVEVKLFSFNESDLGINIRVTPEEHDTLIKSLGAYFAAHGLVTKMLLGDNSDATTYKFIYPALEDPDAKQYIGAISFHSWRGWDTDILQKWADAAKILDKPLLVGEGSTDAQAFGYPLIFQEPTYALEEINLYTRLLNICQPESILQWQLTTDYSPLIGGGIFGNNEPLHPGQRFSNLKQLSSTPKGLYAMYIDRNAPDVSCAALGDNVKGLYTLHIVNNGASRKVSVTGLPVNIKVIHIYLTNASSSMNEETMVDIRNGQLRFSVPSMTYCTIICERLQ